MVEASNINSSTAGKVNASEARESAGVSEQTSAENLEEFGKILNDLKADEAAAQKLARLERWDNELFQGWQNDPFQGMEDAEQFNQALRSGQGEAQAGAALTAQNQQLGHSMAALLAKARGAEVYHGPSTADKADLYLNLPLASENGSVHGHNLLNFMLQQNTPLAADPAGTMIPVLDLSAFATHDPSTIINRITAYLAQNHWAQRPSLAVQVLQKDLGKFFVRADALPNGKIDVQILSSATEFFMQHQDNIRTALADAGVKLGDLKIIDRSTLDTESFLANHQASDEQGRSEQQLAQDDRARRYRLWQQAYRQQEA